MATVTMEISDEKDGSVKFTNNFGVGREKFNYMDKDITMAQKVGVALQGASKLHPDGLVALCQQIEEQDVAEAMRTVALLMSDKGVKDVDPS